MNRLRVFFLNLRIGLHHPLRVLTICAVVFVLMVSLNGTIWQIWSLSRDAKRIENQIQSTQSQVAKLNAQLNLLRNDTFVERTAREKLDFANESDLVFVFSE